MQISQEIKQENDKLIENSHEKVKLLTSFCQSVNTVTTASMITLRIDPVSVPIHSPLALSFRPKPNKSAIGAPTI
jgi:hypothetical protein